MLKQILASGSVVIVMLTTAFMAQAQTQQPAPQPQAPETSSQISPEDLQKFANSIKQLQMIDRKTQTEMLEAVKGVGLTEERFMEIYQNQKSPQAQPKTEISQTEKQRFDQAFTKIQQIQQQTQAQMKQAVETEGLEIQRFNSIMASVQRDPALQKKVLEMIKS